MKEILYNVQIVQYFWLTKYTKMHRCLQIALKFQTFAPHYQGFTDHCKSVLKNGEPNPLSRLRKNYLQDSFVHESVKKLVFFSCSIRLCSEILWIRQFYLLTKLPKRRIRCHQTVPRIQNCPGEAFPRTP